MLRTFETEDAVYHLGLGNHLTSSAPIFRNLDLSSLDFFVFEDGVDDEINLKRVTTSRQYRELYQKISEENLSLPIYGIDIKASTISHLLESSIAMGGFIYACKIGHSLVTDRRNLLRGMLGFTAGAILSLEVPEMLSLISGANLDAVREAYNLKSNVLPGHIGSFRDAIAAKKVSEHLVKKHKKDNQKVQVAMIYGGLHSGIETKLKNPEISDMTIGLYNELLGFSSKEELNQVRVLVREDEEFRVKSYDCGLF